MSPEINLGADPNLFARTQEASKAFKAADSPVSPTRLYQDATLSEQYEADIWIASELHQPIGAYKIRGAYNYMRLIERGGMAVTASAGNHAQGVALSAARLGIRASIFMPETTPALKIDKVRKFGGENVDIHLGGIDFDEAQEEAEMYHATNGGHFVHPFDDELVIAGQGTIALEVVERGLMPEVLVCPVGGGGLISGMGNTLKYSNNEVEIFGVEPVSAPSMSTSIRNGSVSRLEEISSFVDGASVRQPGSLTFEYTKRLGANMVTVRDIDTCEATIDRRSANERIELAAGLAFAGLKKLRPLLKAKTVLVPITGGNLCDERVNKQILPMIKSAHSS